MTVENEMKKAYLMRYKWGKVKIEEIEAEIIQLKLSALPGAVNYDGMPHGSGSNADMSGYAAELDALIRNREKAREKLLSELADIIKAIDAIADQRYSILLGYRYISLKGWREIAVQMGFTEDYVKHLHGAALEAFEIPET